MDFAASLLLLLTIAWISLILIRTRKSSRFPPGPYRFPIIGNIFHIGNKPHQSLSRLAGKYGPIMSLKLGRRTVVVFSSREALKIMFQKHDLPLSSRTAPAAVDALGHRDISMVWLPVEHHWRKLRKICKEHMFSAARVDSGQGLRKVKLQQLFDYVRECSKTGRVVDIGEAAFTTTLNLISATMFSVQLAQFGTCSSQEMKDAVWGVMECIGRRNLADYFPVLKKADPQGIVRETGHHFQKLLGVYDGIIDERMKSRGEKKDDLVEALIDLNIKDDTELSRNDITHLLLDLFLAGTDTTSSTVEWAMAELIRHPEKLSRVRAEICDLVGETGQVQESDIPELPYLQAVLKETFRLHPVGAFLVPRKAASDVEINGYIIPKEAQILVNVWATGRDSSVWSDADKFIPERFLDGENKHVDVRGNDFELIPFGAGRRICPALPLGYRMAHLMVTTFVHEFEWKLEEGIKVAEMDMDEKFGLTLQKAKPLKAIPVKLSL